MKKFGYATLDTPEGHSSETARLMHMHEGYDAVAVSSLNFRDDLAAGFNVDPSIVFEAPLPRSISCATLRFARGSARPS